MPSRQNRPKTTKRSSIVFKNWKVKVFLPADHTASVGMCLRAGEFTEVVKKIVFQGKPVNEENLFHLKRELGDIMWYVARACMGLDTTIDEIIEMNVDKLKSRYPGGEFDVHYSENRKEGDV